VLHHDPDFDCCASAFLATEIITKGGLPPGAQKLARYTLEVDSGRKVMDTGNQYTPYAAVLFLNSHIWRTVSRERVDLEIVKQTLPLMSTLCSRLADGVEADSPESLDWNLPPLNALKEPIDDDLKKYRADLEDKQKRKKTELFRIPLFRKDMTGMDEKDAINIQDPDSVLFKYWARGDVQNTQDKQGFCLIVCNYSAEKRTIVSINPNSNYFLPFLGHVLEMEEVRERLKNGGKDERLYDVHGGLEKMIRWFHNPDPWSDGRGHEYTIVDSPRSGSCLSGERVLQVVKDLYMNFK
jgi:hypothetical protein